MRVARIDWRTVISGRGMARWIAVLGLTAAAVAWTAPQAAATRRARTSTSRLATPWRRGTANWGARLADRGEWLQPRVRRRALQDERVTLTRARSVSSSSVVVVRPRRA